MDDLVEVERHERLVGPQARELLDAADRLRAARGRLLDDVEAAPHHVHVGRVLAHELRVAEDGLQQVVEVVRDAARHLAERGELLGLVHLRLELALRGGVAHDGEQALEAAVAAREVTRA